MKNSSSLLLAVLFLVAQVLYEVFAPTGSCTATPLMSAVSLTLIVLSAMLIGAMFYASYCIEHEDSKCAIQANDGLAPLEGMQSHRVTK